MTPTLDELARTPERIKALPPDAARAVMFHGLALVSAASSRLAETSTAVAAVEAPDRLLDAQSAAERLDMSADRLRRWADCPFLVLRGRRKLYSSNGITRWIEERTR
jgi:hypothetical protein